MGSARKHRAIIDRFKFRQFKSRLTELSFEIKRIILYIKFAFVLRAKRHAQFCTLCACFAKRARTLFEIDKLGTVYATRPTEHSGINWNSSAFVQRTISIFRFWKVNFFTQYTHIIYCERNRTPLAQKIGI